VCANIYDQGAMSTMESSRAVRPTLGTRQLASLLIPPLAIMAVIFYLSDQPNLVPTHGFLETFGRKTFHVIEYTLLTFVWWRAVHGLVWRWSKWAELGLAFSIALVFSISDEFHQSFVAGRHGTARDVAIDAIGMTIAAVVVLALYARRRRVGPSRPSAA
jgi:hypothetical protein